MRTRIYVDGFNLYYGCLKASKNKWLDLNALVGLYFPKYQVDKIKYFSAVTKARLGDLNKPVRQQMYFRALRTNKNTEIILGSFLENEALFFIPDKTKNGIQQKARVSILNMIKSLPLVGKNYLYVNKTEEKGSDVNLGAHLIMDAYEKKFDVAIVISNDSDLAEPIRIVNNMTNLKVRLLNPYPQTQSKLKQAVNGDIKYIRETALLVAQFPENMSDAIGNFHIPDNWR